MMTLCTGIYCMSSFSQSWQYMLYKRSFKGRVITKRFIITSCHLQIISCIQDTYMRGWFRFETFILGDNNYSHQFERFMKINCMIYSSIDYLLYTSAYFATMCFHIGDVAQIVKYLCQMKYNISDILKHEHAPQPRGQCANYSEYCCLQNHRQR